jgi:hypothetical protein
MNRCVIHIGMHKTGSTSIQESLQGFSDDRFVYADLCGEANHSLAIYSAFAANPRTHHLHLAARRDQAAVRHYTDQVWNGLKNSVATARGRTLLISGEDICVLKPAELTVLREYFRSCFEDVTIVGYVRSPASLMTSTFQELAKTASIESFDPGRLYRSYQTTFGTFDDVFGRDTVHLWKFDPRTFPEGCAVQDFCARLGIAFPKEKVVRVNDSLTRPVVTALYTYARFGQSLGAEFLGGAEASRLGVTLGNIGEKFRLAPGLVQPALEQNVDDIAWMEERLDNSLEEKLAPQPNDVAEEADLLRPDPVIVTRLRELLGAAAPARGDTPEEVASLVHALRTKLAAA